MNLIAACVVFALQLQFVTAFTGFALSSELSTLRIATASERTARLSFKRARPVWHLAAAAAGAADVESEALFDAIEAGDADAVRKYIEGERVTFISSLCV